MAAVLSVVVADRVLGHKMVTREAPTSSGRQGMVPLGRGKGGVIAQRGSTVRGPRWWVRRSSEASLFPRTEIIHASSVAKAWATSTAGAGQLTFGLSWISSREEPTPGLNERYWS